MADESDFHGVVPETIVPVLVMPAYMGQTDFTFFIVSLVSRLRRKQ